ncbi:hypothetical protein Abr02nite_07290 [Paractinoplanes brasiliensis]|nr:hypothetical protein Abr02nite_07290 [Actinoplanes brasiliensis]
MRLMLPWGPKARYRRALAAARKWQEDERRNAFARLRLQAATEDMSQEPGERELRAWQGR